MISKIYLAKKDVKNNPKIPECSGQALKKARIKRTEIKMGGQDRCS